MNKPKKTTENSGGWKGTRRETDQKYLAFNLLIEQGISITKAAEMMGYKPTYGYNLAKKIRDRGQNLTVLCESRIRRAHKVVDRLMQGKTFGTIEVVKDSTALRAAEVVLDRAEPKNQDQAPPSISMTQYNLNMVRPGHPDCIPLPDAVENPPIDGDIAPITEDVEGGPDEEV